VSITELSVRFHGGRVVSMIAEEFRDFEKAMAILAKNIGAIIRHFLLLLESGESPTLDSDESSEIGLFFSNGG
jgi:hypothetical protein